jgi:hypothetical protein
VPKFLAAASKGLKNSAPDVSQLQTAICFLWKSQPLKVLLLVAVALNDLMVIMTKVNIVSSNEPEGLSSLNFDNY